MNESEAVAPLTIIRLLERIPTRYSAGALLIVTEDKGATLLAHHAPNTSVVSVHKAQCEIWVPTKKGVSSGSKHR